ncbi:MAG: L-threonylcarbamoyladenylate synthase [Pseudomonadota bacterium]
MVTIDWQQISAAAAHLRAGRLVAMPTETVFGLAGDATNADAVAAIFAAKSRPAINPLIAHVATHVAAERLATFSPMADALAAAFWPGPLTLVLPQLPECAVSRLATAGLDSIAVRAPDHPVAQALLEAVDLPLAAPSANPSGQISPTRANHVHDGLGNHVAMVLEAASACTVGVESTIVQPMADHLCVLRPGAVTVDMLEEVTNVPVTAHKTGDERGAVRAPGMLRAHYAPRAPLRMNVTAPAPDEIWLGFGPDAERQPAQTLWLSERGDVSEAAARLFDLMHQADALCAAGIPDLASTVPRGIAVAPIPALGLGVAINDRLARATLGREN